MLVSSVPSSPNILSAAAKTELGLTKAQVEEILAGLKACLILRPSIFSQLLESIAEDAYKRLIAPSKEVELRLESKERADEAAIAIFAANLHDLTGGLGATCQNASAHDRLRQRQCLHDIA